MKSIIKNIVICIFGALTLATITSCSDFLNEELTTQRNTDYFKTNEGLEDLMTGVYYNLRFHFAFEWGFTTTNYGTDEFIVGGDESNKMWNDYDARLISDVPAVNVNTTQPSAYWDNMYIGIASANTLIASIDNYTGSMKTEMLGTAHFIRGYNHFRLVCQYGGVPLKLTPSVSVEREFSRATPKEVIAAVLDDLKTAYDNLPAAEPMEGKLTKTAAAHFLAKAYLWRASELNDSWNSDTKSADLDEVIKYAQEVVAAHPLAPNYRDLWAYTQPNDANEKLPEIVLAAQFDGNASTRGNRGNQMHLHFLSIYNNLPGMVRDIAGGREYQRLRTTYYTYNVYDHLADSRLWKSFRTKQSFIRENVEGYEAYNPGDVSVMYILNKPGDTRFPAIQNTGETADVFKALETDKTVPTVFAIYPSGSAASDNPMEVDAYNNRFASLSKYVDGSRNSIALEQGNRDGILARSAEDYFFIAEAYIRKGDYPMAYTYLKQVRDRAQWKAGENRSDYIDGGAAWKSGADGWGVLAGGQVAGFGTFHNRNSYYESNDLTLGSLDVQASNLDIVTDISTFAGLPAEDRAICEKLGYTSAYDIAMCFLLNEKTREFCGEFLRWEDLARTKTLIDRAKAFNRTAAPNIKEHHYLRPIPQNYLDAIQKDGRALTPEEKRAEQNLGY